MGLTLINILSTVLLLCGTLERDARLLVAGVIALHVFNAVVVLVLQHLERRIKKDA